jgi:hypothetical protein
MAHYPELTNLDWNKKISYYGEIITIREFVTKYKLENNSQLIIGVINKLIKKGKLKLISQETEKKELKMRNVRQILVKQIKAILSIRMEINKIMSFHLMIV